MVKEEKKPTENPGESTEELRSLILYNDDFNTFDFVIETLIELCEHEPEQAEQCALVVHFKGKCAVKSGTFYDLKPICEKMSIRDLTVEIK